jgi:hypothetical protein
MPSPIIPKSGLEVNRLVMCKFRAIFWADRVSRYGFGGNFLGGSPSPLHPIHSDPPRCPSVHHPAGQWPVAG